MMLNVLQQVLVHNVFVKRVHPVFYVNEVKFLLNILIINQDCIFS